MGKRARELKQRIKLSVVGQVFEKGRQTGEVVKAFRQAKPILDHVDGCSRCKQIFAVIQSCSYIMGLPNGSMKEANNHILEHEPCRFALKQILECPVYGANAKPKC